MFQAEVYAPQTPLITYFTLKKKKKNLLLTYT